MNIKMTLSRKIWLSISILILGYVISMFFTIIAGSNISSSAKNVSDVLFPSSVSASQALNLIKNQLDNYEASFMMGEEEQIQRADRNSQNAIEEYEKIKNINNLPVDMKDKVIQIIDLQKAYTREASRFYLQLIEDMDEGNIDKIRQYAERGKNISLKSEEFYKIIQERLRLELDNVNQKVENQKFLQIFFVYFSTYCICYCNKYGYFKIYKKTYKDTAW